MQSGKKLKRWPRESDVVITTSNAAVDALTKALEDVDNKVGAGRAVGQVARRFRPVAPTSWEAFRFAAQKAVEPWFKREAKAVVYTIVDPYFGLTDQDPGPDIVIDEGGSAGVRVRCMADVEPEEVTWLWGSRIPRGKLTEIVGDPGVGKSTLTTAIVATLTNGRPLPGDEWGGVYNFVNVLLLSAEDGAGDTIRPRLDRAGADVSRVHLFDGIEGRDGGLDPFDLKNPLHRLHLARLIDELDVGLLIIDPLTAYLGGVDSHRDADVRGVLTPLAEIAESSGCAVLAVRHLNKGNGGKAVYRAGGSIGFTAAVRSSMLVGRVDEESNERAVVVIKSNLAATPNPVGFSLEDGRFEWTGTPDVVAADLLRPDSDSDERGDREITKEWLVGVLRDGPMPSIDIYKKADTELSVSKRTVKRAKSSLGGSVRACRESHGNVGGGRWVWELASGTPPPPDPLATREPGTLAKTVAAQGLSTPEGSEKPQGDQDNLTDPLADFDDPAADVFDGLEE